MWRGLVRLRVLHRQPLVAALTIAHKPRRHAVDDARLQILPHRNFAAGKVADVAVNVGVPEVLRAEIEMLQRRLEVTEVARTVDQKNGFDLLRRAEADVLHAQRRPSRGIQRDDRPAVAARHHQGGGRDVAAGGDLD